MSAGSALLFLRTIVPLYLLALFSARVQHPMMSEDLKSAEGPGYARAVLVFYVLCSCGQLVFNRQWVPWWIFSTFLVRIQKASLFKNPCQLYVVGFKLFEQNPPYWDSLNTDIAEVGQYHYWLCI